MTVKAIDNDASFSAKQIGMNKFALDKDAAEKFDRILRNICFDLHGKDGWKDEYDKRASLDPAIVRNKDGSMTIDLSKATSAEVKMAVVSAIGMQSPGISAPEEIDEEFYNVLMEMDGKDSAKRKEYLDSIAPRISPAVSATSDRHKERRHHHHTLVEQAVRILLPREQLPVLLQARLHRQVVPAEQVN